MPKQAAHLLSFDEIEGTPSIQTEAHGEPITLTRGDDAALVQELRDLNEEEKDDNDQYYWKFVGIAHLPHSSQIEWRSGRGHFALTVVLWL